MRDCEYQSKCATGCDGVRRVDIKTQIKNQIDHHKEQIAYHQEQLRIEESKLGLLNKNKDLEAYINLDRR